MSILKKMLQSLLFIIISTWVLLAVFVYFYQPYLIYFPNNEIQLTPEYISLDYEDVTLTTNDGIELNAWWIPNSNSRATLLFFHGNAGNISHRLDSIEIFYKLGLSVLIIDYRGYGKSTGKPSEKGTYIDAETAWNYLINEKNIKPNNIIIFGRSLGGAIAAPLAKKKSPLALIIESSFTSISDIGKYYYPYLPVSLLARIKYSTKDIISDIRSPILFIHSNNDEVIPYKHGKTLYEYANHPKSFLNISGGHNDGFIISRDKYTSGIDTFITNILK